MHALCECPVWEEGRGCEDLSVHLPGYGTTIVEVFLSGLPDIREVNFGLLLEGQVGLTGWRVVPKWILDRDQDATSI